MTIPTKLTSHHVADPILLFLLLMRKLRTDNVLAVLLHTLRVTTTKVILLRATGGTLVHEDDLHHSVDTVTHVVVHVGVDVDVAVDVAVDVECLGHITTISTTRVTEVLRVVTMDADRLLCVDATPFLLSTSSLRICVRGLETTVDTTTTLTILTRTFLRNVCRGLLLFDVHDLRFQLLLLNGQTWTTSIVRTSVSVVRGQLLLLLLR